MGHSQPITVDGAVYPSRTAAIMALHALGTLSHSQIGDKVGCATGSVGSIISQQKRKAAKANPTPEAMPGQWTPEKRDKVRRLFGKTMILIADAVQVPPGELLTYVLHGVIPPSQAVSGDDDIRWKGEQAQLPAPSPVAEPEMLPREAFEQSDVDPPATLADTVAGYFDRQEEPADHVEADDLVEPDREDDEAELAALDALEAEGRNIVRGETDHPKVQEVAPPAPVRFQAADPRTVAKPVGEVRLIDETGRYLHESLDGMTTNPRFAWKGDAAKLKAVQNRLPHTRQLDTVPV